MLAKKNRLSIKKRLARTKEIISPLFVIKFARNKEQEKRVSIIVRKEIDKRAVYRNRLKRRFANAIKELIGAIEPGLDFLIIAKKEALGKSIPEIKTEIKKRFKKEKLLR